MQKECILTASDVRFLIQNMGTERCSYFFTFTGKKLLCHMFIIFAFMCTDSVGESCLSVLSYQSELLTYSSLLKSRSLLSVKEQRELCGVKLVH